jgi:sulfonate transport system substrate-binding protein
MTESAFSSSQPKEQVSTELWYSRCGAATTSALAIRKNWLQTEFAKGGTVLHSLRDSADQELQNSHYHHQLSGLFREGGNIPPIWARARGADTAVIGITWLDEYQGVLARVGSGIRSPEDLVGKRLALPVHGNLIDFQRGAAEHGFVTALGLLGKGADSAQFVAVPVPEQRSAQSRRNAYHAEMDALLSHRVDAIFVRFARGARLAKDPRFQQVIDLNGLPDPLQRVNNGTPRPITVDRPFLQRHPDLVVRYLMVLLRTADWAETHRAEVLDLLRTETGAATIEDVLASHGPNVHRSFVPRLTPEYLLGLETQKNFLRDFGYLEADFAFEKWIEPGPLREAEARLEAGRKAS